MVSQRYLQAFVLAIIACAFCSPVIARKTRINPPPTPALFSPVDSPDNASIEDLIKDRIDKEWKERGTNLSPELIRAEADYARMSSSSRDMLYEASFHLKPRYYSHGSTGPDTSSKSYAQQPVMYYIGSARTPLALPMVSNLSKALSGDEASYTINIGVLPLPMPSGAPDSMRYFVVIERAIESNHTDNSVSLERFSKEFSSKVSEPVFLRLANEPLSKGAYIVKLEDNSVLDFYDDFSRFIEEHIILKGDTLAFKLGHETISDVSDRLSIPYSVSRTCNAKVELLSVVDTEHAMTIIDTVRDPADYLAEVDMSHFSSGPYRYRFTAIEPKTGKVLYTETHAFNKSAPIVIVGGSRLGKSDTLQVGGNKKAVDYAAIIRQLDSSNAYETVLNDRISTSLTKAESDRKTLQDIVQANKKNSIADVHGRAGIGSGTAAGDNLFIGIESNKPALSFDVSFGFLGGSAPYLDYHPTSYNISQIGTSPKSLGFQLTWIPVKFFDGLVEPTVGVSYYGIWGQPSTPTGLGSAALLSGQLGIACDPSGEVRGIGFSLSAGLAPGLGISQSIVTDFSFKLYTRF